MFRFRSNLLVCKKLRTSAANTFYHHRKKTIIFRIAMRVSKVMPIESSIQFVLFSGCTDSMTGRSKTFFKNNFKIVKCGFCQQLSKVGLWEKFGSYSLSEGRLWKECHCLIRSLWWPCGEQTAKPVFNFPGNVFFGEWEGKHVLG